MPDKQVGAGALRAALEILPRLDIPAKGRIAHHIRKGRLQRALTLCEAGQLFIWKLIWAGAKPAFLEQLALLKQVEALLIGEANNFSLTMNGDIA